MKNYLSNCRGSILRRYECYEKGDAPVRDLFLKTIQQGGKPMEYYDE